MHFVDECTCQVEAGDGGDGAVAFRREKFVPFGGPAGGDGGRGGSVFLQGDAGRNTLYDLRRQPVYRAQRGENGMGKDCNGAAGKDLTLLVPLGTIAMNPDTGERLGELTEHEQRLCVARGGQGGKGNRHFATPTDRAPRKAEPGTPGQKHPLQLELRVIADVGMLGYPNVGKSTFVSTVSRARPRIADYPFTTLHPQLGVVSLGPERSFVVADIPGLIEGASEGTGLGLQFLRHVRRTRLLLHLVTLSPDPERDPLTDYQKVRKELAHYHPELSARPEIVALSQCDRPEVAEALPGLKGQFRELGIELRAFSSATRWQMDELLRLVDSNLQEHAPAATREEMSSDNGSQGAPPPD